MPEPQVTERDQTRPLGSFDGDSRTVAPGMSFADMPSASPIPRRETKFDDGLDADVDPELDPEREPESTPAKTAAPEPAEPPANAGNVGAAVVQALDLIERRRTAAESQAAARAASDERMRQQWEPSALPENMDEYLADGGKMRDLLQRLSVEDRQAVAAVVQPLANEVAANKAALTVMYQTTHRREWEAAVRKAEERGISDPNRLYGAVNTILQANPQTYWEQATNSDVMAKAMELIEQENGTPRNKPRKPFQSAERSGGERNSRSAREGNEPRFTDRQKNMILKVQKSMGVTFGKDQLAELAETPAFKGGN